MVNFKTIAASIFVLFPIICSAQGLKFTGMEGRIEERTSLDIHPQTIKPLFKEKLKIEFQMSLYPQSNFGYILRVKDLDDKDNTWNMSYEGRTDTVAFRLNEEGYASLVTISIPQRELGYMTWIPVQLEFNLESGLISLNINGEHHESKSEIIPHQLRPIITFGKSEHMIDVPSFAIKDLKIWNGHNSIYFPLNESEGNIAHQSDGHLRSKISNPTWLIKESSAWQIKDSVVFKGYCGTAWNPLRKEIYLYNKEAIHRFGIVTEKSDTRPYSSPCPLNLNLCSNYLDTTFTKLVSYEVHDDSDSIHPMIAELDLERLGWSAISTESLPTQLHHHCSFRNAKTNEITVFGGFGNSLYNGRFYTCSPDGHWNEIWENPGGDKVCPRYFASSGCDENGNIYIFGGMGNKSGEQIVGRKYFYDLHKIDAKTGESVLLWNIDWKESEEIVPVKHLYIHEDSFYTLCYPEYKSESGLSLYRFSLTDGSYERYGDVLHIHSDSIHTYSDLFFDPELSKFICIIYESHKNGENDCKIYTLSFPPLKTEDTSNMRFWLIFATSLTLIFIAGILLFRQKCRNRNKYSNNKLLAHHSIERPNSIMLMGDFCAFDKRGRNISYMFSSKLRDLMVLLLLYHKKGGIQSKSLSYILWPDKDDEKMKNSRGVALSRIRKILEEFDDISLVFDKGSYQLIIGDTFYCDYLEIVKDPGNAILITDCLLRGKFLEYDKSELWDEFKASFDGGIIPILQEYTKNQFNCRHYQEVCKTADVLLKTDPQDEIAINYLVKALKKMNRTHEASIRQSAFANEYKRTYDQAPDQEQ